MRPAASTGRRPWRWPLGGLFALGLTLGLGLWGWVAWLWRHWEALDHSRRYRWVFEWGLWPWLAPALWLAVAALGLLGLVLAASNLVRRNWRRALWWLLLAALAAGHCAVSALPVAVAMGSGITPDVPKE